MTIHFNCPKCGTRLTQNEVLVHCSACSLGWPVIENVPRFIKKPYYWGEVPQELMSLVNDRAEDRGWEQAVRELVKPQFPEIYHYITNPIRADFAYLIPLNKESAVLDVGSGWGTISCLLARRCGTVVSVESVSERIDFTRTRAEQDNLKNLFPVQANFLELPFSEPVFDLIVLNGVLEWIGIAKLDEKPDDLQRRVLQKLFNCLKPGGFLYIGIENRFGYNYFFGGLDHSDLPYTSLMPRWLADWVMRTRTQESRRTEQSKSAYRTYTYSYWGYQSLLRKIGFEGVEIYLVFPDYNDPAYLIPADNNLAFRHMVEKLYAGNSRKKRVLRFLSILGSPIGLPKIFSPCYSIVAQKAVMNDT